MNGVCHIFRREIQDYDMVRKEQMIRTNLVVEEAISRYVSRIKDAFGDSLCQVVLFGLQARGEAGPESDIDLMVITIDPSWETECRLITMGYQLFPETGAMLSAKVRTPGEFDRSKKISFLRNVKLDGFVVG